MVEIEEIKDNFAKLAAIDSPSLKERNMADYIIALFKEIGVELKEDDSAATTGSTASNLHGYVKGNGMKPILLAAHMDTVMPAYGKKAIFHENGDVTSDGTTVLGADDLSGVVEIYELIKYLNQNAVEHRDIELLFTTGEELYCVGAKAYQYDQIVSKEALVLRSELQLMQRLPYCHFRLMYRAKHPMQDLTLRQVFTPSRQPVKQ